MGKLIKNSWALFLGYSVIILAHGLQGNLLGLRAVIENFSIIATGALMSGYFIGYFVGATIVPNLVGKVGHIRVFAAFASTASLSILLHSVIVDPYVWFLGRFITGFSIISIFVVVESWLNDRATNKTRGKVLSIYMIITFIGLGLGVLLLNFNNPKNYEPFILVSLLLSLALVPILLTRRKPPTFKKIASIKIKELYKISPLGTFSMFCTGFIHPVIFTLGAVYGSLMNFSILEISLYLFLITISGAIFQWPIGYLSDRFDRRIILIITTLLGSVLTILCFFSVSVSPDFINLSSNWKTLIQHIGNHRMLFYIFISLYAGMCLPLFSLNLAYVNDFLPKEKFVSAGAGMQIIFGLSAMVAPFLCSFFMKNLGPNGLFIYLFIFHTTIGLFGIYRMTRRSTEENPENTFTAMPRNITPLGMELDPDAGVDLSNKENKN
ncbi:MFS transporter [Candidatus Pelagibacter sp.]|nr:MFS transporter [Candidatus Pelagibacter sp.]